MNFKFSISLVSLVAIICAALLVPIATIAACTTPVETQPWYQVISENWAIIGLLLSEAIAFLPTKAQGIAQGVYLILTKLFKKNSASKSKSN